MTLKSVLAPTLCAALAGAGLALCAVPASAQPTVDEVTVMGRYGSDANVRSLSQPVAYADLDLATGSGQHEFRHRIKLTARFLCDQLGESNSLDDTGASCRSAAISDGMKQADAVIAGYPPHTTVWVAGPVWAAPYPTTWGQTYPY